MTTDTSASSQVASQIDQHAERVDQLTAQARQLTEAARTTALDLKSAIEAFHKEGIIRIVRHLRADPRGKELLLELASDPTVYTLFLMHGIVRSEAPANSPEAKPQAGSSGFVSLQSLLAPKPNLKDDGWHTGPAVADLREGKTRRVEIGDSSVVLITLNGTTKAFRNECAHQGLPLDGGMIDVEACTITCPWHGFRFDGVTGECLSAPQAQLEPVNMRIDDGVIWLRP